MPHFMLSWLQAVVIAGCLAAAAAAIRLSRARLMAVWGGVAWEAALLFGLYGLWQFAGSFTVMSTAGALPRARWLWHAERVLHLPSEAAVQRPFLPHPLLAQAANLYYDILHFPILIGCLIWLYARHRDRYRPVRTTVALFTGASLGIQLIPVAPPRLLPGTGMVDTAAAYGQSVYAWHGGLDADQFSAMPSVHVGWALIVAIAVIGVSRRRWRWLAAAYPLLTMLAVVVTANHFWLDEIAAALLVVLALAAQRAGRRLQDRKPDESLQVSSVPGEMSVPS
ncbi:MAG: phosphatase PAP2 family protein [Streptosporangiaceae bacterium]|nr:phosphatase PAP2 family protein [Streptosporangiaceae bacterium]